MERSKRPIGIGIKKGLPQTLTSASLRDQRTYQEKLEKIKEVDIKLQSDKRSEALEGYGALGLVLGVLVAPATGAHWYTERRNRIKEREMKLGQYRDIYNSSR